MDAIFGLVFTALAVFIGLALLMTFDTTRTWAGLGDVEPTGVAGYLRSLFGGGTTAEPAPAE